MLAIICVSDFFSFPCIKSNDSDLIYLSVSQRPLKEMQHPHTEEESILWLIPFVHDNNTGAQLMVL